MKHHLFAALAASVLLAASGAASAQTAPATYIQAGRLLADPATGEVLSGKTLVVQDGKVVRIEDGFTSAPGAQVIDLKDSFVLPGLIDSHVHLTAQSGPGARMDVVTKTAADGAIEGAYNARKTLEAGFTTVVDLGGDNDAVFALRDGIRAGKVEGPRIIAAGSIVTPEGGHGDAQSWSPAVMAVVKSPTACSGADTCRRVVREQVRAGADVIKIVATGGVLDDSATGVDQQFTDDELKAIMETAHMLGRQVAAHAHGTVGINAALKAGVDSIEHGTYLDQESIKLFKAHGAYLVPTLLAGSTVAEEAARPNTWMTPNVKAKALQVGPNMIDMARRAHAAGVKMAFGTDSGVSVHGVNAREFALLAKAGFTPIDAIRMATTWGADHDRMADRIGALRPGMQADVIAVKGDPMTDVSVLEHVSFVMKGGTVYKH
jgi:imidazolonepropionase-like amidohydrolase